MPAPTRLLALPLFLVLLAPCAAQPLHLEGALGPDDPRLDGGEHYDLYEFDVEAGRVIEADLTSDVFDTYLLVVAPSGAAEENDDMGSTTRSYLLVRAEEAGRYRVIVTSYAADETGPYRLSVGGGRLVGEATPARPEPVAAPASIPASTEGARPRFGAFAPGDEVIYRSGGPQWWPARVEALGDPGQYAERNKYRLRDPYGSGDYAYYYDVARPGHREAWWTGLFVGDWRVSIPVAANVVGDGRDLYRQWSGGMALPPLRIHADGTYLWRVEENGRERVVEGRWEAMPDHPGLVLLDGQDGDDWTVYNATYEDRGAGVPDDIILSPAEGAGYLSGTRLE